MKKSLQIQWFIGIVSLLPTLLDANTYTFTSAGATGREGPTQAQVDANYTGTSLDSAVTVDDNNTQGIQEWTVPADGNYSIEALGAQGGGIYDPMNSVAVESRHKKHLSEIDKSLMETARILEASVDFELMAYELETGLHSIGEIIGRKDNEDMLDSLFNQFCIGK